MEELKAKGRKKDLVLPCPTNATGNPTYEETRTSGGQMDGTSGSTLYVLLGVHKGWTEFTF